MGHVNFQLEQLYPADLQLLWAALGRREYVEAKYRSLASTDLRILTFDVNECTIDVSLERRIRTSVEAVPAWAKDGAILDASHAQVRSERSGTRVAPGNGRVYTIKFAAASCSGSVTVSVNTTAGGLPPAVNDGSNFNSVSGVADASCQTVQVTNKK